MNDFLLFAAIILTAFGLGLLLFFFLLRRSGSGKKMNSKNRNTLIKTAKKRIAQNPKDRDALLTLADMYYSEKSWNEAMSSYKVLMDLCATDVLINEFEVTLRFAVSALKLKNFDVAHKYFLMARTLNSESFEVNYNLGVLEYKKKNYDKAALLLKNALARQPEHLDTWKYLGHSLYKLGKYREALSLLKRVYDNQPDDKDSLFAAGQCYAELALYDQAVKIFTHLRPDPVLGPQAALMAGLINLKTRKYDKAVMDLEIGLRHPDIPVDILLELKYRLASAYLAQQEIGKALHLLHKIKARQPSYKDVEVQIVRYRELAGNNNLKIYLVAAPSDFVALCRKITLSFIPDAKTKITDISVETSDYADILAEVETGKWHDLILFRYIRSSGKVGELALRDFQVRLKETRAGRGFCFTAGEFTEEAVRFVEARLIDLIDKPKLIRVLEKLG